MTLSSTAWAALMALAVIGIASGVLLGLRAGRRASGILLFLAFALLFAAAFNAFRSAARSEEAERRFHAGIDAQRHGDLERARQAMREALSLEPGHPEALRSLDDLSQPATNAPKRQTRVRLDRSKGKEPAPRHEKPFHKPSPVRIVDYTLDVSLFPDRHSLSARAAFTVEARTHADRIELALSPEFRIGKLLLNGAPVTYLHTNDLVSLSSRLRKGESATIVAHYARRARDPLLRGGDLIDPRGVYLRPESRWYPSVGELDFHAPLQVSVRVPRGMTAVCAGLMARKSVGARDVTFHWESPAPVQMICLAAGKYSYSKGADGPVVVETYLRPEHAHKARAYQAETQRILSFYAGRFGSYPYPKLAIAEIPVFPGGYGSTSLLLLTERTFAEKEIPIRFLAHEIAHQWWGNHVAPQGLGAGWLSEAFAEYSAALYREHADGPAALKDALKGLATHYRAGLREGVEEAIAQTDPYDQVGSYEGIIYFKGAYVLHSLRRVVGDDAFKRILRLFAQRHGGGYARIADFEALAAEVHGQPLAWFFDQWLRRPGAPRLKYAVAGEGSRAVLTVAQEGTPYHGEMDVLVTDRAGKTRHTLRLDGPTTRLEVPARGQITSVDFDPDNEWLLYTPRWVKSL